MNIAFQIEALTNSDGARELMSIECDPTSEPAEDALEALEVDVGAWEFRFIVPEDFDGSESVFRNFRRYGLDPQVVHDACCATLRESGVLGST